MEMGVQGAPQPALQASAEIDLGQELTDGFAIRYIRLKGRQLVVTGRIPASDRQDLEQDLVVKLLERIGRFDPARAHWNAYVATVIERQVATLLESRRTQKRRPQTALVSLSTRVKGEEGAAAELAHLIQSSHQTPLTGYAERDRLADTDLKLDIAVLCSRLPLPLACLAERLRVQPLAQIARERGVRRSKLYEGVARLRQFFEGAGSAEEDRTLRAHRS